MTIDHSSTTCPRFRCPRWTRAGTGGDRPGFLHSSTGQALPTLVALATTATEALHHGEREIAATGSRRSPGGSCEDGEQAAIGISKAPGCLRINTPAVDRVDSPEGGLLPKNCVPAGESKRSFDAGA